MAAKAFITGGSGLLGEAVVRRMKSAGGIIASYRKRPDGVVAYDPEHKDGLAPLSGIEVDLAGGEIGAELPPCDTVIHLAQSHRYKEFPAGARDVFGVNVRATQSLLAAAVEKGAKRFVFASTGSVYLPSEDALNEHSPLADQWQQGYYAASKRASEMLCAAYAGHITVVLLRFFFIYGPGQSSTMLMPRLIDSVTQGRDLILQGNHGFRLNPVYVDDAADAVIAASRLTESQVINVAGPEELTFRQLGQEIGLAVGCTPRFSVLEEHNPNHCVADTRLMRERLVVPTTGIAEGLRQMTGHAQGVVV